MAKATQQTTNEAGMTPVILHHPHTFFSIAKLTEFFYQEKTLLKSLCFCFSLCKIQFMKTILAKNHKPHIF
jgi:hypothetical protein